MKPNAKTYLFVGEDSIKKTKLEEIFSVYLSPSTRDFNYDLVYPADLNKDYLLDVFSRFPVNSDSRVLRIKDVEALSQGLREILIGYLKSPLKSLVLILETNKTEVKKDKFLNDLSGKVDFFYAVKSEDFTDVFDLGKAIVNKNTSLALKILKDLDVDAKNAPKILGGIIWKWEQMKFAVSSQELEAGFNHIYETERQLKTGKVKPDLALELLVIVLSESGTKNLSRS